MTILEIILLLCGLICVIASFIIDGGGSGGSDNGKDDTASILLTEEKKQEMMKEVSAMLDEQVKNAEERTEASLDRISNTKILEMNEYAENILGQINRNHNETVFLYDMLNDKAKEVKTTVKDVNAAKRQIEKMQTMAAEAPDSDIDSGKAAGAVKDAASGSSVRKSAGGAARTASAGSSAKTTSAVGTARTASAGSSAKTTSAGGTARTASAGSSAKTTSAGGTAKAASAGGSARAASKDSAKQAPARPKKPASDKKSSESVPESSSGTIAKERLRRVVAKDTEEDNKARSTGMSEEDRMDAAIRQANDISQNTEEGDLSGANEAKQSGAKARTSSKKPVKKTQTAKAEPLQEVADMNIQFEKGSNNNEMILKMYREGKNNKDIAKELNLGVGEVKLVIDLYNSTK